MEALAHVLDEPVRTAGFTRNRRSLVYTRKVNDAEQRIAFIVHCHPKYQLAAEAHICPALQVIIPKISQSALALVKGDKMLLAGAPEIVIGQPIDFTAPKAEQQRWFATGGEQFVAACDSIRAFLSSWVLPFLSEISTPAELVRLYETNDARVLKQKHWHIFVAAAYQVLSQLDKARQVVRHRFGSPGLRKRYAPLFASLAVE